MQRVESNLKIAETELKRMDALLEKICPPSAYMKNKFPEISSKILKMIKEKKLDLKKLDSGEIFKNYLINASLLLCGDTSVDNLNSFISYQLTLQKIPHGLLKFPAPHSTSNKNDYVVVALTSVAKGRNHAEEATLESSDQVILDAKSHYVGLLSEFSEFTLDNKPFGEIFPPKFELITNHIMSNCDRLTDDVIASTIRVMSNAEIFAREIIEGYHKLEKIVEANKRQLLVTPIFYNSELKKIRDPAKQCLVEEFQGILNQYAEAFLQIIKPNDTSKKPPIVRCQIAYLKKKNNLTKEDREKLIQINQQFSPQLDDLLKKLQQKTLIEASLEKEKKEASSQPTLNLTENLTALQAEFSEVKKKYDEKLAELHGVYKEINEGKKTKYLKGKFKAIEFLKEYTNSFKSIEFLFSKALPISSNIDKLKMQVEKLKAHLKNMDKDLNLLKEVQKKPIPNTKDFRPTSIKTKEDKPSPGSPTPLPIVSPTKNEWWLWDEEEKKEEKQSDPKTPNSKSLRKKQRAAEHKVQLAEDKRLADAKKNYGLFLKCERNENIISLAEEIAHTLGAVTNYKNIHTPHITLAIIPGNFAAHPNYEKAIAEISDIIQNYIFPFELCLSHLAILGYSNNYIGVMLQNNNLKELHTRIIEVLKKYEIAIDESFLYSPHITLARSYQANTIQTLTKLKNLKIPLSLETKYVEVTCRNEPTYTAEIEVKKKWENLKFDKQTTAQNFLLNHKILTHEQLGKLTPLAYGLISAFLTQPLLRYCLSTKLIEYKDLLFNLSPQALLTVLVDTLKLQAYAERNGLIKDPPTSLFFFSKGFTLFSIRYAQKTTRAVETPNDKAYGDIATRIVQDLKAAPF